MLRPPTPTTPILFCHLGKTAGYAVGDALDGMFDQQAVVKRWFPKELIVDLPDLVPGALLVRGHHPAWVLAGFPVGTQVITMLRDPVARAHSMFRFLRQMDLALFPFAAPYQDPSMDFATFCRRPETRKWTSNVQCNRLARTPTEAEAELWPSSLPAIEDPTTLPPAVEAARAEAVLDGAALVGTTERLDDFFRALRLDLGWPLDVPPPLNTTSGARDIDDATIDLLHEVNEHDLDLHRRATALVDEQQRRLDRLEFDVADHLSLPEPVAVAAMDTALPLHGVHGRLHRDGVGWYRWTGPSTETTFGLRPSDRPRALALLTCDEATTGSLEQTSVIVDGRATDTQTRRLGQRGVILATVPASAADRQHVAVATGPTATVTGEDGLAREAGLALARIGVADLDRIDELLAEVVA